MTITYHIDVINAATGEVDRTISLDPPCIGYCWSRRRNIYEVTLITRWSGFYGQRPTVYVSKERLRQFLPSRFDKLCGCVPIKREDVQRPGFRKEDKRDAS
ncbi:hypothetical protein ACX93W_12490 [Paenibacillus sp. CAU 1782]